MLQHRKARLNSRFDAEYSLSSRFVIKLPFEFPLGNFSAPRRLDEDGTEERSVGKTYVSTGRPG
ncbi:hypothetical protein BK123_22390 [Paenibacillus lautus]|uniref:Uncharacterized protein n=1 Tax=Paenibacillus lautus TaxID=1401 RepID=A0A1R1AWI4_PAELA|nr:hypothetical protein BK123_22390 [Paenibacillus lautus]